MRKLDNCLIQYLMERAPSLAVVLLPAGNMGKLLLCSFHVSTHTPEQNVHTPATRDTKPHSLTYSSRPNVLNIPPLFPPASQHTEYERHFLHRKTVGRCVKSESLNGPKTVIIGKDILTLYFQQLKVTKANNSCTF